jgi:adenylosuccinate synthase
VYDELPGWQTPISGIQQWNALPANAQSYLRYIQQKILVPVTLISVGSERNQTILV